MSGFSALNLLISVVMIPHSPSAAATSVELPYSASQAPKKRCRVI